MSERRTGLSGAPGKPLILVLLSEMKEVTLGFSNRLASMSASLGRRAGTGLYRKKSSLSGFVGVFFLRSQKKSQTRKMIPTSPTAPPTAPPTMIANREVVDDVLVSLVWVAVGVLLVGVLLVVGVLVGLVFDTRVVVTGTRDPDGELVANAP